MRGQWAARAAMELGWSFGGSGIIGADAMVRGHFSIFCSDSYVVNLYHIWWLWLTSLRELYNKTVYSKNKPEILAREGGFKIKSYHSDNGIFASAEFKTDCKELEQKIDFSGVGAQHQNGIAERNIGTVSTWACANMLHSAYHWPQQASIKLWPMAINYAVRVFNHLPSIDTGLCPDEMWSQSLTTHDDLRRAHVWGCPVYVLEPELQDGKKMPKRQP